MGKKYVQGEFLGEESLDEKNIWVKSMCKKSFWVKSFWVKSMCKKSFWHEEPVGETYMGEKYAQQEFLA